VKRAIKERLIELAAEVYDEGVQELITGLWQVPKCWWRMCRKIT
jgi:hypothetical protein